MWYVNQNLQRNFVKMGQLERVPRSREAGNFKMIISSGRIAKLRTCDIPSATCNVFQSSQLHCKLQGKLHRVTWPLVKTLKNMFLSIMQSVLPENATHYLGNAAEITSTFFRI